MRLRINLGIRQMLHQVPQLQEVETFVREESNLKWAAMARMLKPLRHLDSLQ